jgi:TIR domain
MTTMAPSPDPAETASRRPLVFISHRHEDKALADVIGKFLKSSSGGRVEVYQSSDAKSVGPRAGGYLSDQLKDALWRAGLLILVYTRPQADWSWCMYECGLALQRDTPDTILKVFTCDDAGPPQFEGRVLVKIKDRADVLRFTNDFLTDSEFFPNFHEKVAPGFNPNDASVVDAADQLFEQMCAIPVPDPEKIEDWPAYPFLQIELTPADVARVTSDMTQAERLETTIAVLHEARITDSDSEGARIFGRREIEPDATFGSLLKGWCDTFAPDPPWEPALAQQVMRGVQWAWPDLRWELMRGVDSRDATLYGPVVTRVRRWPSKRMQFDVCFCPFGLIDDGSHVRIGIPQDAPAPGETNAPARRVG